jgi:hypothetical protein
MIAFDNTFPGRNRLILRVMSILGFDASSSVLHGLFGFHSNVDRSAGICFAAEADLSLYQMSSINVLLLKTPVQQGLEKQIYSRKECRKNRPTMQRPLELNVTEAF